MKKNNILILAIIIVIIIAVVSIIYVKYKNYKAQQNKIKENNLEYETYLNKEILGTELTTFINKAVDNNEKNKVPKDEQGNYIPNDTSSIKIEIKITDNDTLYQMETLYGGGMATFVAYYNDIHFECTKIGYNSLGKVNYMLFEQKTN